MLLKGRPMTACSTSSPIVHLPFHQRCHPRQSVIPWQLKHIHLPSFLPNPVHTIAPRKLCPPTFNPTPGLLPLHRAQKVSKWIQNGFKIDSKWIQNGAEMEPKWMQNGVFVMQSTFRMLASLRLQAPNMDVKGECAPAGNLRGGQVFAACMLPAA